MLTLLPMNEIREALDLCERLLRLGDDTALIEQLGRCKVTLREECNRIQLDLITGREGRTPLPEPAPQPQPEPVAIIPEPPPPPAPAKARKLTRRAPSARPDTGACHICLGTGQWREAPCPFCYGTGSVL